MTSFRPQACHNNYIVVSGNTVFGAVAAMMQEVGQGRIGKAVDLLFFNLVVYR